ncbi:translationally-controlled tumor protein [Suillus fuscotomentosus]|uniref:Translationally-controlled tumor protein homolog n=1 Tax=Suillus fuscotomentosus TaxID=1912939 RepID=A0AAD4HSN8_9AGAM|nr:translationally-controlled tumor protein [Suillus fuscotomentosus]KAG1907136.1 translationally-controlled tumor protein [Suillus fuscotomentosus]
MLLYEDIISGDEMFSDAFPMKEVDGIAYEVDCQMITLKEGNVDIGANASAEEQEEALEDGAITVNNIAHSFRLQTTAYDKKAYLSHLKGYMKAVAEKLAAKGDPAVVTEFKAKANDFVKKIVGNFKDYEFYTGENMDADGMVALLNYREDGVTPYFTFWKHGLKEVKL